MHLSYIHTHTHIINKKTLVTTWWPFICRDREIFFTLLLYPIHHNFIYLSARLNFFYSSYTLFSYIYTFNQHLTIRFLLRSGWWWKKKKQAKNISFTYPQHLYRERVQKKKSQKNVTSLPRQQPTLSTNNIRNTHMCVTYIMHKIHI